MPIPRRILACLLITVSAAVALSQSPAMRPLRGAAAPRLEALARAASQQATAILPRFGQATQHESGIGAASRALAREQGVPVDRNGAGASTRTGVIRILKAAAVRHQLDPKLVVALSYWESGWDQSRVSVTGAVGLMQVEPPTAAEAGPALLGRPVNVSDPVDNADVGAAVLRHNLDTFGSPEMALAAYYQGESSLRDNGMLAETQTYVAGIMALAGRLQV